MPYGRLSSSFAPESKLVPANHTENEGIVRTIEERIHSFIRKKYGENIMFLSPHVIDLAPNGHIGNAYCCDMNTVDG